MHAVVPRSPEVLAAIVIVCATAIVLAAFKHYNRDNGAEHFFKQRNKLAYAALQLCYFVVVIALVFNLRFVALRAVKIAAVRAASGSATLRKYLSVAGMQQATPDMRW
jgi:TctA family transporter